MMQRVESLANVTYILLTLQLEHYNIFSIMPLALNKMCKCHKILQLYCQYNVSVALALNSFTGPIYITYHMINR